MAIESGSHSKVFKLFISTPTNMRMSNKATFYITVIPSVLINSLKSIPPSGRDSAALSFT